MSAAVKVTLLGARGVLGASLVAELAALPHVALRSHSGQLGAASYEAFLADWSGDADAVVIVAGGRSGGPLAELVEGHLARTARLVDRFDEVGWPGRVLLIGSAAELLLGSRYGELKAAQRRLLTLAAAARGIAFRCLRLHSLVPAARPPRGLFAELLGQYAAGGAVSVHHLGGARDYVSGTQLGLAVATMASSPEGWGTAAEPVLDVGNGMAVTVSDWLEAFRAVFGREARLEVRAPDHADPVIVADPAPLRAALLGCAPEAAARYDAARPDLVALIRGWQASVA